MLGQFLIELVLLYCVNVRILLLLFIYIFNHFINRFTLWTVLDVKHGS
jgi:hypothetical protein